MVQRNILQKGKSYSFRHYFELPYEPDDILAEFGYDLHIGKLNLPHGQQTGDRLSAIREQMEDVLPLISLSSEMARREVLVAPVLMEVVRLCRCQLKIEYPLVVNERLKGNLDYLLRSDASVAVVEAKREDLSRGFTQLAVELIALAEADEQDIVYGAVTIGEAWRFGKLDKPNHQISQDLTLYKVPDELEHVLSILIGIIQSEQM